VRIYQREHSFFVLLVKMFSLTNNLSKPYLAKV
jgi:hypothetical protein